MSLAIGHVAVGAGLTALVVALLIPDCPYPRTLVLVGGGWAMVPDVAKLVAHPWLLSFHDSPLADLFWIHRTLDLLDPNDSATTASALVLAFVLVTALVEYRDYRALTTVRNLVESDGTEAD